MKSARIALPTLLLAITAGITPAPATAGPWGLGPGEWFANFEGSTFTTSSFYDGNGSRGEPGLLVQQRALRLDGELGWKKRASLVFGLPAMSVTRRDARVEGTATGFQALHNFPGLATGVSVMLPCSRQSWRWVPV